eukprot:jgi/Chrpa1/26647/Chrysochromulina_OHIO_Genome00022411-RA
MDVLDESHSWPSSVRDLVQPQHAAGDEVVTVTSEAAKCRLDLSRGAAFRIGKIHSVHRRIRQVESMTQQQRVRGPVQMGGERRGLDLGVAIVPGGVVGRRVAMLRRGHAENEGGGARVVSGERDG